MDERNSRRLVRLVRIQCDHRERGKELETRRFVARRKIFAMPASEQTRLQLHHLAKEKKKLAQANIKHNKRISKKDTKHNKRKSNAIKGY